MDKTRATITYLFHSGYAIETAQHFFLFDYYQPLAASTGNVANGIINSEYLKTKKNIYIFASHAHADHFDPIILDWVKDNPDITYILSSDIKISNDKIKSHFLSPYEDFKDGEVFVKTFGSTDQGISFHVQADGLSIFHAGDLNWWHWKGETPAERNYAEAAFKTEIEKIVGQAIDIAFFPVDRRLEEFYAIGAEYFADKLHPTLLLPMHFGADFGASKAFSAKVKGASFSTVEITHKGQKIEF